MTAAITIENLTKRYNLGQEPGARALSEQLALTGRRLLRRGSVGRGGRETFEALSDVSLEIEQGDTVGLIGANGAGKSTLLKLISRITRPTRGTITLNGRVGSLLEVGTGFHPELSGRENVFLNGSMLGMRRAEIERNFDAIVDFAEVEQFIDTPVKRYSSGMYVRLAFAIAAHLEPEILIVDEVLAVGDVAFQQKCIGKMGEVAGHGRTVLFVSHSMGAVQQLTQSALYLERGRLVMQDKTSTVVAEYMRRLAVRAEQTASLALARRPMPDAGREVELVEAELVGDSATVFAADDAIRFRVRVRAHRPVSELVLTYALSSFDGQTVGAAFSGPLPVPDMSSDSTFVVSLDGLNLAPGQYFFTLATGAGHYESGHKAYDCVSEVLNFEVAAPQSDAGTLGFWTANWGSIRFPQPSVVLEAEHPASVEDRGRSRA